ncbi:MAG: phosphatidate cytidylyltransferase [Bacilli bacterium]|nr:phosphatidate cytidylyltransferase [Bacilli bacterium]MDD4298303.1 phosphatidate cytidylyltransferase [Bacilli bacterium]
MKQRIITALVLLLICIPILIIGGTAFTLFTVMVGILGLKEIIDIRDHKYSLPLVMKLITFGTFVYLVVNMSPTDDFVYLLDYRSIALVIFLLLFPIIIYHDNRVYNMDDALFLIGAVFFLGISFNLLIMLREHSFIHIIYLFIITTMTDTYALIGGMLVGKHKLLESISPKKTWEGLIIGTVFGVLISSVFYYIAIDDSVNIVYLVLGTTLLSLIGQFGDLVFSSMKRLYNKKDFSNLMPGHGGVLDRLDSIIFASLGYLLLMFVL